ncbi:MAG: hypothetical protein J7K90_05760 [Desulfuromusa sp.]|nr:hypothetical protein [Desulfuromusa sp.]
MERKENIKSESIQEKAFENELLRKIRLSNLIGYISYVALAVMACLSWVQGNMMLASRFYRLDFCHGDSHLE